MTCVPEVYLINAYDLEHYKKIFENIRIFEGIISSLLLRMIYILFWHFVDTFLDGHSTCASSSRKTTSLK